MSEFKRRITIEDLNQLTEEQKVKLCEWWKPTKYDLYIDDKHDIHGIYSYEDGECNSLDMPDGIPYSICKKMDCLPLLDISQMIEIIGWQSLESICIKMYCVEKANLCDQLWEEVKEVL